MISPYKNSFSLKFMGLKNKEKKKKWHSGLPTDEMLVLSFMNNWRPKIPK